MLATVLEELSRRVEGAGVRFGPFVFDGSSEDRRCTFGPVDPEQLRHNGLMLGWDYYGPVGLGLFEPESDPLPIIRPTGPGLAVLEPRLPLVSRTLNLHLYMRETRPDRERIGYDLPTSYLANEERILRALGLARSDYATSVLGIDRAWRTEFAGVVFVDRAALEVHAVMSWQAVYPATEGMEAELIPVEAARRAHLVRELEPDRVTQIEVSLEPLSTPEGILSEVP